MNKIYNFLFLFLSLGMVLSLMYSFIPSNILPIALIETNTVVEEPVPMNENTSISIFGEVNQPGVYAFQSHHLTLSKLVEKAGDFTNKADKAGIVILRKNKGDRTITYSNSRCTIVPNHDNLILQNNDVVYIEPLYFVRTTGNNYKHQLPFASAFICVAAFLISVFKG